MRVAKHWAPLQSFGALLRRQLQQRRQQQGVHVSRQGLLSRLPHQQAQPSDRVQLSEAVQRHRPGCTLATCRGYAPPHLLLARQQYLAVLGAVCSACSDAAPYWQL